jgi:membrane protease YdiL (CAAX protease family)
MEELTPSTSAPPITSSTRVANPYPIAQSSHRLTLVAWNVTILLSSLPDIVFNELTGGVPLWLGYTKMGLLLLLITATVLWKPLRPLRRYFIAMLAFFALLTLRASVDFTLPAWQALFGNNPFEARMQAEQTGKLIVALLMIVTMLVLGYRRRDFFLARGDLRARIDPVPLLGFPKPDPWWQFGLQWGFYIAAALAVLQYLVLRPSGDLVLQVVLMLPSILVYAALNAFNEELTYRAPMLATLETTAGSKQALWMSAYFFGIAHYFGTPGGLLGGLLSIFMGWILGKAMVETRGLFWAWWIHFLSDVVIFTFLTISLLV